MTEPWYYAAGADRHGLLAADDLLRLYQGGRLRLETPVWREGLPGWVPLASVAASLGLPATPPPLPPARRPPEPRRGLHGAWIVLLVLAGLAVPVLAILAAIAIPAYNDYRVRAGVAEVAAAVAPLQHAVDLMMATGSACPIGSHAPPLDAKVVPPFPDGLQTALSAVTGHRHVRRAHLLNSESLRYCELHVELTGFAHSRVDGAVLTWSRDPHRGTWSCRGDARTRDLPPACRG